MKGVLGACMRYSTLASVKGQEFDRVTTTYPTVGFCVIKSLVTRTGLPGASLQANVLIGHT
jgi:hypothetical protein